MSKKTRRNSELRGWRGKSYRCGGKLIRDMKYESCARYGYDHEVDSLTTDDAHTRCEICAEEIRSNRIGELNDHHCVDHRSSHVEHE